MTTENIKEIGIDELGRLYIVPNKETFEFIYRYAAGVNWDGTKNCLYSPTPTPEMKYDGWFQEILLAVKYEYGVELQLTKNTVWNKIEDNLKKQLISQKKSDRTTQHCRN